MPPKRRLLLPRIIQVLVVAMALMPLLAKASVGDAPSNRQWMRANGAEPGRWVVRKFEDTDGDGIRDTWNAYPSKVLTRNNFQGGAGVDCQSGCHSAPIEKRRETITSPGFTNAFGETPTYVGTQDPGALLSDPANDTAHAEAWRALPASETNPEGRNPDFGIGCAACHSMKAADARGIPYTVGSDGKASSGGIVGCKSCHNYKFLGGEPAQIDPVTGEPKGNLHLTHATLVTAEIPLADPGAVGSVACNYCHSPTSEGGVASCYNCHLSGHWPKVPYWKAFPEG